MTFRTASHPSPLVDDAQESSGLTRRSFLQIAGVASVAASGLSSRRQPARAQSSALVPPRGAASRYVVDELFYFMQKTPNPKPSTWTVDEVGGSTMQQYGRWFRLTDASGSLPVTMVRPFEPQTGVQLVVEFRFDPISTSVDGIEFAVRADTTPVARIRVVGTALVLTQPAGDVVLVTVGSAELGIRLTLDLTANTMSASVNGAAPVSGSLLATGVTVDNFLVASGVTSTEDMYFGPLFITRDLPLNETFAATVAGSVPALWSTAASGLTLELVEGIHGQWADRFCLRATAGASGGQFAHATVLACGAASTTPIVVSEFRVRFEAPADGFTYRVTLADGTTMLRVRITSGAFQLVDFNGTILASRTMSTAVWNHVKLKIDVSTSRVSLRINGKPVATGVAALGGLATASNRPTAALLALPVNGIARLDDVRVYHEGPLPADYPPAPQPVLTGNVVVGMQEFGGWRTGSHLGWDTITRFPDHKPLMGWYDDGNPEVADWEKPVAGTGRRELPDAVLVPPDRRRLVDQDARSISRIA